MRHRTDFEADRWPETFLALLILLNNLFEGNLLYFHLNKLCKIRIHLPTKMAAYYLIFINAQGNSENMIGRNVKTGCLNALFENRLPANMQIDCQLLLSA